VRPPNEREAAVQTHDVVERAVDGQDAGPQEAQGAQPLDDAVNRTDDLGFRLTIDWKTHCDSSHAGIATGRGEYQSPPAQLVCPRTTRGRSCLLSFLFAPPQVSGFSHSPQRGWLRRGSSCQRAASSPMTLRLYNWVSQYQPIWVIFSKIFFGRIAVVLITQTGILA
jgi:hypothetical protein